MKPTENGKGYNVTMLAVIRHCQRLSLLVTDAKENLLSVTLLVNTNQKNNDSY